MHINLKKIEKGYPCYPDPEVSNELYMINLPLMSVLVVEDNPAVCKFMAIAMESFGCKVMKAENGEVAYGLFMKNRFDLVITDFQMPVMNGPALIRKLKSKSPEIPIILTSGKFSGNLTEIGYPPLKVEFLSKPFSMAELYRAILNAVSLCA
jgi:CheY-like chemotaxis protein